MKQKRLLSVQDISCFGKCANTVALPVISAAGVECVALPTALLSTHTGGFTGYTFLDLTEEMAKILAHFSSLALTFDTVYTGYFGSREQLSSVKAAIPSLLREGGVILIDPVLGDGGKLYSIYDEAYVDAMREYCRGADFITPNVTEACLLAGIPYEGDRFDADRMAKIFAALADLSVGAAIITGVRYGEKDEEIGVSVMDYKTGRRLSLSAPRIEAPIHGTGDVFASAPCAYLLNGFSLRDALSKTIAFMSAALSDTVDSLADHWYGVRFEDSLYKIANDCREARIKALAETILEGGTPE